MMGHIPPAVIWLAIPKVILVVCAGAGVVVFALLSAMRRYFWGLVIILVVMALAMSGAYSVRMEHSAPATIATESGGVWDTVEPIVVQRTVRPTAPAKVDAPPRR